MDITSFFESWTGIAVAIAGVVLCLVLFALVLRRKKVLSAKTITYSAICIALATVLSLITLYKMPTGGSITAFSMFFITLVGFWFGPFAGILAGVTHGLIQLAIEPYVIHPVQLLMDYPFAFGALGLSGFFWKQKYGLYTGYLVGITGRFFFSCLSGVVFFSEYAGEMNAVLYSVIYNLSYILPEAIITLVIISLPAFKRAIYSLKTSMVAQ